MQSAQLSPKTDLLTWVVFIHPQKYNLLMDQLFLTILYQNTANLATIVILVEHMVSNNGFCVMVKCLNVTEVTISYMLCSYYTHDSL